MKDRILVTGGAGFIGSNLIKRLVDEGHSVTSLDNYSLGKVDNHVLGVNYINNDVTNINNIENRYDIIFHLAALSRVQPSFTDPDETFRANVLGTQKVCDYARAYDIKLIYAGSSSKHYDPNASPYAFTKYTGEEICKLYKKTFNMNIEIARFYNVYGPNEIMDGDYAAVVGRWRQQIKDSQPLTIIGTGEKKRDYTHVDDIVEGLVKIAFKEKRHEDAWELGAGVNYSVNELFGMFKERFINIDSLYLPDQSGNYETSLRANNDANEVLDWQPKDRLKEYIQSL